MSIWEKDQIALLYHIKALNLAISHFQANLMKKESKKKLGELGQNQEEEEEEEDLSCVLLPIKVEAQKLVQIFCINLRLGYVLFMMAVKKKAVMIFCLPQVYSFLCKLHVQNKESM